MKGSPLTARQAEVLGFITSHIDRHGYPPTYREIGSAFGISINGVNSHLRALRRKGSITLAVGLPRTIRVDRSLPFLGLVS